MKRSTFKVLFFLKRDKQKSNGLIPLFCRITVDGQESRFGMKCDVNPKYWDVKTGKATGRTADASQINSLVATTHAAIYRIYREVQERDNYVTAEKIKNIFLGIEQKQQTLLELFDEHNREQALQIGLNVSKPTYAWYCTARKHIAHFLLYKYNLTDIAVKEIKRQFIIDFETFLIVHHHYSQNSVVTILKKFRHIIELALNREWIYKNPFSEYKLRWQKTDRGYLTQSEIESLIHCECEDSRLEQTRDVFIFCCFTGLAYTDIKHLTYGHIQSSVDGNLWLRGKRKKTDIEYNIPLLNIPKTILEKYRGFAENDLVLPVGCLPIYNRHLKELAKLCNINKTITSHLARHTFATLTLTKGVSIESVSKMLGHTNIQTTQIYAKITAKKISNEMNAFAEKINEMGMTLDASL